MTSGNCLMLVLSTFLFGTKAMFSFYRTPWLKMLLFIIKSFYSGERSYIFLRQNFVFYSKETMQEIFSNCTSPSIVVLEDTDLFLQQIIIRFK